MKNKNISKLLVLFAIVAFTVTACQKESIAPVGNEQANKILNDAIIGDLVTEADDEFLQADVLGDGENAPFSMHSDGLIDAYLLQENSLDAMGKNTSAIIRCLSGVSLDSTQKMQVRKALALYEDCKKDAVASYRSDIVDLNKKVQSAREDLMKKFRNGDITRDEFRKGMENLRNRYQAAAAKIKASYSSSLRACYNDFLNNLKRILSDRQWAAFTNCLRKAASNGGTGKGR